MTQSSDLVGTLRTALSQLAAPDKVVIRDFEGNEFALPAALPARRQVRVFATLAQLIDAGQKMAPQEELTGTGFLKLLVFLVSTLFLLLEMERIGTGISNFTPPALRAELGPWVARINHVLNAYIRGQLILVVMISSVTFVALTVLQVRFAPLLAIFTGLVETMPFIGPYTAGATAVALPRQGRRHRLLSGARCAEGGL